MLLERILSGYRADTLPPKRCTDHHARPPARALRFEQLEERLALTIVAGAAGTANNTPPVDDPGFNNIGIRGSGSAIYLGDGWVLTATHVGAGNVQFNNIWYTMTPGSAVQITNPSGVAYTTYSDLMLFKIDGRPDLPSINIGSAAPGVGWDVVMIGYGRDRNASQAYWTSTWQPSANPATYTGYIWTANQAMRWGTNVVYTTNMLAGVGANSERTFVTQFTGNTAYDAQGAPGDSGGGVFAKDGNGQWNLIGVMAATGNAPNQLWGTSVFGNVTYSADLSVYRNQILAIVGVNHAPGGASSTVNMASSAFYTLTAGDFHFSDPNDAPADNFAGIMIATLPASGALTDNGASVQVGQFIPIADINAGKLVFTPGAGGATSAAFSFKVQDDGGTTNGGLNLDPTADTLTFSITPVDTTPPTVSSVTPSAGAVGVALGSVVTVTFSESVDAATVRTDTIYLMSGANVVAATVSYNAATKTATVTPTGGLSSGASYSLTVVGGTSGVKDTSGNALATSFSSSFSALVADLTPPVVTAVSPTVNATNVAINTLITVTFSEAMDSSTITRYTVFLRDNQGNTQGATVTYNAATATATLTPASPLVNGVRYTITVVGGASGVKDAAGNALAATAISAFTTDPGDITPPVISTITPASGVINVALNSAVTIVFNEAIDAATVSGSTVYLSSSSGTVSATVSYNAATKTVTLTPSAALSRGTNYTLTVVGGAGGVKDLAGNALSANVTSSFATDPGDITPPVVLTVTPAVSAVNVPVATTVTVTFSEAMDASTINTSTIYLQGVLGNIQAATVTYNAATRTATLTPSNSLAGSAVYTATILGGTSGVKDLAGNALASNALASFTTIALDIVPPVVVTVTPGVGATDVPVNSVFTAKFNEGIDPSTVNSSTVYLRTSSGAAVAATISYNAATATVKLTPTSPLAGSTTYTVTILGGAGGVKDLAGNALVLNAISSFTTVDVDATPPVINSIMPSTGSTGVDANAVFTVVFSEALDPATVNASTVFLRTSGGAAVAATVSYDAATSTVTLTSTSPLAGGTTFTLTILGGASGVKDLAGNALANTAQSTFTTVISQGPVSTTQTIWPANATPAAADSGDVQSIEVGVRFATTTNGFITGIRYYKSAANTGVHTGSLWSSTGQLLATATFTDEGGSGWQQVNFSSPVAVVAGAVYTASYHTNVGHYAVTRSSFGSPYTSGAIQVQANGGVYAYGVGGMPTQSYQSSNYWVDVVFSSTVPVDTTPPVITTVTPNVGATGVATSAVVTAVFSEALDPATVNASTVYLRTSAGAAVSATVSYNAATSTITLTPTSPLASGTAYKLTIVGGANGVKDLAGNALASTAQPTFTTVTSQAPVATTQTIWPGSATPAAADSGDVQSIEVGVRFVTTTSGFITGIRYYKSAANTGVHTGSLWSSTGQLLATATFADEGGSGWQQVNFGSPVAVVAGAVYTASYHTNVGHYAVTRSSFGSPYTSGAIQVQANGGVYAYGVGGMPTQSYQASNYWVDVVFSSTPASDTTPPVITAVTPNVGAAGVATSAIFAAVFSEALDAATVNASTVYLRTLAGAAVAATVSYNASTSTVTLTPTAPLALGTTYKLTILGGANGVKDLAGNALANTAQPTFTTVTAQAPTTQTILPNNVTPAAADSGDMQSVEVGVKFIPNVDGLITGVRFYKSAANTGIHTGSLWTADGQLLATGTFTNETASGWQDLTFATPVAVSAGVTYVASYLAPQGHYAINRSYFTSSFLGGAGQVPASGGVYRYGSGGFPTLSYQASNYWVDVSFTPE